MLPRIPLPLVLLLAVSPLAPAAESFTPDIAANVTRPWPGKDFWANPAEDWIVSKGRLENIFSGGNRNLVLLTAEMTAEAQPFTARVHLDQISYELFGEGFAGFQIGLQGVSGDFREAALEGTGFAAGIDLEGRPFIGNVKADQPPLPLPLRGLVLELKGEPAGSESYALSLMVQTESGDILATVKAPAVEASWLRGLLALAASTRPLPPVNLAAPRPAKSGTIAQTREGEARFAFAKLALAGGKFALRPERAFGPILWTTYTFDNDGTLCLLVQAAAFGRLEKIEAGLQIPGREPQKATLDPASRTARFRLLRLDAGQDHPYEVTLGEDRYAGVIRHAPGGRPLKIASLSCNDGTGFPHAALVANVRAQQPDFLTFHGDQIHEGSGGYGLVYDHRPNDRAILSYLRKYALHGWTWRELLRDTPSVTLPDEHDVFHGNLWGAAGKRADISGGYGGPAQDSGGYKMAVDFVNAVHRTQTGNLPDAGDPSPCRSGISVYFTRHAWGPLDFIVLADRQFKSAPAPALPGAEIRNGWPGAPRFDAKTQAASPDADLLGLRQENYLARWAKSPAKDAKFRIVLSQSPFCAPQTLPKSARDDSGAASMKVHAAGGYPADDEPKPDFHANAWPAAPRLKALRLMQEARAIHLTGDQHPGSTGQYGLEGWNDGPWWISTPAIATPWPRRWMPAAQGRNRRPGAPRWTGEHEDAFGNHMTLHAAANPQDTPGEPARLHHRAAAGYTLTTWDPASGRVRLENWPCHASPAKPAPDNRPYPGWPVEIDPRSGERTD